MDKKIVIGLVLIASLLVACSVSPEVSGRKIAPPTTGAFVAEPDPIPEAPKVEKTAAEALSEVKSDSDAPVVAGATIYPPVTSDKIGEEALKERTRAAYSAGAAVGSVDAVSEFGSKYYTNDGQSKNLPAGYDADRDD